MSIGIVFDACFKVAIVDWDVHHGNNTQKQFYANPNILYISVHQWPLFPSSGLSDEIGDSRISFYLEGGYHLRALEEATTAVCDGMMTLPKIISDRPAHPAALQAIETTTRHISPYLERDSLIRLLAS